MLGRVIVSAVDPRDQDWELDRPRYRAYFYEPAGASYEYEVTAADVDEVLHWARQQGRAFVLYVCVVIDDRLGLVRLAGADPSTTTTTRLPG